MMYYMTSKTFRDIFLPYEHDEDILNAQYVLVSTRIRRTSNEYNNIVNAAVLYPEPEVCMAYNADTFRETYFKQLKENMMLLAILVRSSIEKNYNIIFLCTKNENKMGHYLNLISEFIYLKFGYPVYNYKEYVSGKYELVKYDKAKVYAIANKYIKKMKYTEKTKEISQNFNSILDETSYVNKHKKTIKQILKANGLYRKGMTDNEMANMISLCINDIERIE